MYIFQKIYGLQCTWEYSSSNVSFWVTPVCASLRLSLYICLFHHWAAWLSEGNFMTYTLTFESQNTSHAFIGSHDDDVVVVLVVLFSCWRMSSLLFINFHINGRLKQSADWLISADVMLFVVLYDSKVNVFGFWTVDQTFKDVYSGCGNPLWPFFVFF